MYRSAMLGAPESSFITLQRLQQSFLELRQGRPAGERTLLRLAAQLGAAAVPLCARELAGADEDRGRWAYALLERIGGEPAARARVVRELSELSRRPGVSDAGRIRALALLTELDAPLPDGAPIEDLAGAQQRSLHQLAACLEDAAEVARAADLLRDQLANEELLEFVDALTELKAPRARALIDELLLRDDVPEDARHALRQLRAPLVDRRAGGRSAPLPPPAGRIDLRLGVHPGGRLMVVATQRQPRSRPPRWRALCALIAADGALIDALFRDDYTPTGLDREVVEPLRAQGFVFDEVPREVAREAVLAAARLARSRGRALPRAYYLGRDMLGLYDEHQPCGRPTQLGLDLTSLLGRAVDLLAAGEPARARPLLERYVAADPSDPDGCANLGLCLLGLGDAAAARPHLARAVWLEPDEARHHWNLASAAHRDGDFGACYLALVEFLARTADVDTDLEADLEHAYDLAIQRHTAEELVAEYERLARLEYPDVAPARLARTDELFCRARIRLQAGSLDEAIAALRQAVRLAPTHYPSWRALGAIHTSAGRFAEARRCLERALALKPADGATLRALDELAERRAAAEKANGASSKRSRPARTVAGATGSSRAGRRGGRS